MNSPERLTGCLLGTAVADALGLAAEGLSRRRQARLFADLDRYHFLFGKGFCSDDTEHACMTAQALIVALAWPAKTGPLETFRSSLAWRLRFWLLGLPAGIGMATLKGIVKLWLGFPARNAGVNSAGNAPAMRSALLGLIFADDPGRLREFVRASARLTHTDIRAEDGAYAVAVAAAVAASTTGAPHASFRQRLHDDLGAGGATPAAGQSQELLHRIERAIDSAERGESTACFAADLGCEQGVTGFVLDTVPVALHAWLAHPDDYRAAVQAAIRCGGDADTVAAITGAIVGARVGPSGIPPALLADLAEWPRTRAWIGDLGAMLGRAAAGDDSARPLAINLPGLALRNLLFFGVVLVHGFRRLLPPYR